MIKVTKTKIIVIVLTLLFGLFGLAKSSMAATYYVCDTGSVCNTSTTGWATGNDSNLTTQAQNKATPWKTIGHGVSVMSAGDTLVIGDGTYTGSSNVLVDSVTSFPPSGISRSQPTTIMAEHIGQVIIDGQYTSAAFDNADSSNHVNYLHIEGILFRNGKDGVFGIMGSYDYVNNCGFEDGGPASDSNQWPLALIQGGSDHVLIEDSWAWGRGRYGIYFASSNGGVTDSIIRRCVVRMDSNPQGPTAGIMFYVARNCATQNDIVVDSQNTATSSDTYATFAATGNSSASGQLGLNGDIIDGSIGLNTNLWNGFFPQQSLPADIFTIQNSVFWGTSGFHQVITSSSDTGTYNINHVVSGASTSGDGFWQDINGGASGILNVTNSIAVNNVGYGLENTNTSSHVDTFGNALGASSNTTLTNSLTTNPFTTALKYLPRIEAGSPLKGAASDGGDIGATILYQIGGAGIFYGDPGWNTVSGTPLWPLPNERMWTNKLQAYAASGPSGNRGFASSGNVTLSGLSVNVGASQTPLTDYVWSYLGNPKPANIYGSSSDTTAPAAPGGLMVN